MRAQNDFFPVNVAVITATDILVTVIHYNTSPPPTCNLFCAGVSCCWHRFMMAAARRSVPSSHHPIRRDRGFRDRTNPLDTYDDIEERCQWCPGHRWCLCPHFGFLLIYHSARVLWLKQGLVIGAAPSRWKLCRKLIHHGYFLGKKPPHMFTPDVEGISRTGVTSNRARNCNGAVGLRAFRRHSL